jgi:DNA-binding CsgD family transcriptional regulator
MSEDIELAHVVDVIYDAALHPAHWADALARIVEFVGGETGAPGAEEMVSKFIEDGDKAGLDLQYMQMLARSRGKVDTLAPAPLRDAGQVTTPRAFMPAGDDCGKHLDRDCAPPRSRDDAAGAVREKSEQGYAFSGGVRGEANEVADHEMRRRVALIAPHLRRAVLVRRTIDRKADEAAAFVGILDGLSAGLFLVDADGRIVHANAAGRGILAADDFLRAIGGRLTARDAKVDRSLQGIFADRTDLAIGGNSVALPLRAQDGERHVARILPIGTGARSRVGVPSTVIAAVLVCKATLEIPSSPEVIQRAYHLTPTELRVLLAIVNVGGIPQVATALGVADSTIKTHVGRLFAKTGAVRQADLVKLVAGFFTPLVA